MENWAEGLKSIAITVTDENGDYIDMNLHSKEVNLKDVNKSIIGQNIMGCHNERSKQIIEHLMKDNVQNVYTITKKGQKKLIYQTPWYKNDGSFGGLVEFSLEIPDTMPHYNRDKQE
ncbi:MAG: diguanylate cyclase [Bacteroidales bacterium]|nr:diguanylate cyclase [Bacteroidales bacterium]